MRAEAHQIVKDIEESIELLRRHLDVDASRNRLTELNAAAEAPDLWSDSERAQAVMRERTHLENALAEYQELRQQLEDAVTLAELAEEEGDDAALADADAELAKLREVAARRRLESLLSGEADANDAWLEVHAGAGGTESQDWAEMLARMYARWAERTGYDTAWEQETPGEEAGIKSTTMRISGRNAYGWLKTESGVHRLVRISPFDSSARRHTSFASVWANPVIDEDIDIDIEEKDLRIDTYRASGAGGQHVNRTDSAVRITHLPTEIVVQCQSDRSQHKNRAAAMAMLRARLYQRELERRDAERQAAHEAKTDIGWGHQIRSYVLHPYQMVKDTRTGVETGNTAAVLDGELDPFMRAALAARIETA
ncbi:MAG: peptide chain release factor 2 [Proteobacteria bacterium]|nr:peptide chain release factor 2 [Pseudomonadota bacterium]